MQRDPRNSWYPFSRPQKDERLSQSCAPLIALTHFIYSQCSTSVPSENSNKRQQKKNRGGQWSKCDKVFKSGISKLFNDCLPQIFTWSIPEYFVPSNGGEQIMEVRVQPVFPVKLIGKTLTPNCPIQFYSL